ncbi:MAG: D-alanyl-D-alanine carboxypeptidase/D-alanyl-D-alanine-endopeptidase [Gammaproteobacteria bacterium]|nr:D-alanyl-D-alanine carboxypeptidase/D-alanyl-D-alanine-endopeptidase [Gammaproteobacteria bacterium]
MKQLALVFTWIVFCLCCVTAAQARSNSYSIAGTQNLSSFINQAVRGAGPNANVGIIIRSMKNGETLYARNERNLFIPASILKILTAEAGLLYLGPNFHFSTQFVGKNNIRDGKLYGDVYLIYSGDPTLTFSDLGELMAALKARGINEIVGSVYIDTSAYDQVTTGPGWLWSDKRYCYAAPISASIINHNCLSFQVSPAKNAGYAAQVVTSPRYYFAGIHNSVMTRPHASRTCYVKLDSVEGGIVSISGCMAKGRYSAGISTVINDTYLYDRALLRDLFSRYSINILGAINSGKAPANLPILASHDSKPLSVLISEMLKMSDNIIAGSLFKKIGQMYTHRPGTWENGGMAVNQILSRQAGVDIWHLNVIDGSGLSRYNQATPRQMLQLLDFAFHHPSTNIHFVSALPIAGVDGTLKRRMQNIAWRVRAKTGTMAGVVSLAGYAMNANKEPFAFVIMINGNHGSIWKYRELEDKVLTYLTHYSRV